VWTSRKKNVGVSIVDKWTLGIERKIASSRNDTRGIWQRNGKRKAIKGIRKKGIKYNGTTNL